MIVKKPCLCLTATLAFSVVELILVPAIALSPQEIGQVVKPTIVRIITIKGSMSGIIIKQKGLEYSVLTTSRIVAGESKITIVTSDGNKYSLIAGRDTIPSPNLDLAVLRFSSNQKYKTANVFETSTPTGDGNVFIAGYPQATRTITSPVYSIRSAKTQQRLAEPLKGGYSLMYKANLLPGMEGGGIFDSNGSLIGVHGYSVNKTNTPDAVNPNIQFQEGRYVGIPITSFTGLASSRSTGDFAPVSNATGNTPSVAEIESIPGRLADVQIWAQAEDDYKRGRYQQAIQGYSRYITKYPKEALAYGHRGNARFSISDKRGAITDFDQAFLLDPNLVQVLKNRAIAKFGIGDRAGALADAEKSVQIKPNDPEYLQLLGLALYENGKKAEAIKYLQQAIILYRQQGNTTEAQRTTATIQQIQQIQQQR